MPEQLARRREGGDGGSPSAPVRGVNHSRRCHRCCCCCHFGKMHKNIKSHKEFYHISPSRLMDKALASESQGLWVRVPPGVPKKKMNSTTLKIVLIIKQKLPHLHPSHPTQLTTLNRHDSGCEARREPARYFISVCSVGPSPKSGGTRTNGGQWTLSVRSAALWQVQGGVRAPVMGT